MNTKHVPVVAVVINSLFLFPARDVQGFGPYAHWRVGSQVGLGLRTNLPDYWGDSWAAHWIYVEIIPLFPWTHGCMRTGLVADLYPDTPTVYEQARAIAERDMYHLVQKMTCLNQQTRNASDMIDTARGFLVHNRFDAHGHFGLFPGGSPVAWGRHSLLEKYVDYRMIDQPPGTLAAAGSIPVQIGAQANVGIVLLAQKSFRKTRHTIDLKPAHSGEFEPGVVQTYNETDNQITSQASALSPLVFSDSEYTILILEMLPLFPVESFDPLTLMLNPVLLTAYLDAWWTTSVAPMLQTWADEANSHLGSMPQVGVSGCLP